MSTNRRVNAKGFTRPAIHSPLTSFFSSRSLRAPRFLRTRIDGALPHPSHGIEIAVIVSKAQF
jgi:hypothetical protein